jgi:hypothetical protein
MRGLKFGVGGRLCQNLPFFIQHRGEFPPRAELSFEATIFQITDLAVEGPRIRSPSRDLPAYLLSRIRRLSSSFGCRLRSMDWGR